MFRKIFVIALLFALALPEMAFARVHYRSIMRRWTVGDNIYDPETFNAKINWRATYLSPEFRQTARTKITEWKKLPPGEMTTFPSYLTDNEEGVFLVAIYTPKNYPPINADTENFWDFTLNLPGGATMAPSSIDTINVTEQEIKLFPYIDRWSTVYRVKFPVGYLTTPFTLALRSAPATSVLQWK